jgi:hypothetical protein
MKQCNNCEKYQDFEFFYKKNRNIKYKSDISSYTSDCKECTKNKAYSYRKNNPENLKFTYIKNSYGIDKSQWISLFNLQGGRCAICRENEATHVDHNHSNGEVRGLLCSTCNVGLGMLKENEEFLNNAIKYINFYPNLAESLSNSKVG